MIASSQCIRIGMPKIRNSGNVQRIRSMASTSGA
jgi:hypothetical protein